MSKADVVSAGLDGAISQSMIEPGATTDSLAAASLDDSPPGLALAKSRTEAASERKPEVPISLPNADSILRLDLPQQLEMIQLLDLVGEYLHLDCMYEPEKMRGQAVTLKLHGKLQGEMRVKDLYLLLESVLKFKGFAMTCHEGNLVTIVPAAEALQVNPNLIDAADKAVELGDLVVTGMFDLQHISVSAALTLLQTMKLSLAVTPVEGSQTLIVTCYAHQIDRIERLLGVVDRPGRAPAEAGKITSAEIVAGTVAEDALVVVLEATNSLVINATEEQHARIEAVLDYLDAEVRAETIPYEIYFLENQDPENLAQVLEKIIHETIQDKEGKLQQILRNTDDQIIIVPDKETFSLIIYASRKNQEWISKLIKTLDRRRPQVLIDVTLVEIRKTDDFNYDLNLITSFPDLVETGGQTGSFVVDDQTVVDKLLEPGMRSQFADFQSNSGAATGFYADIHINALLKAIQKKNYGRVLAKPKVLVNDNEKGTIKTTDTTYVTKKSSIPVTSGAAGQQNTLIETAVAYEPYDAGITLEITPHINRRVVPECEDESSFFLGGRRLTSPIRLPQSLPEQPFY